MVVAYLPQTELEGDHTYLEPAIPPFAGRLGGNQDFIVDRNDPKNVNVLERVPDAAPCMTLAEIFDLRGFLSADLWKFAMLECIASLMNVFISSWVTTHPLSKTTSPQTEAGVYHTVTFFSPLFGGITNLLLTPLLIYTFSPSSGGHISPTITLATFFARIISFPRMILYLAGQTLGGALAGLLLNSAYGTREFTVGGCHIDTSMVPATDGLVIEFVACLILIFLAFGVALDPRQAKVFGPATGPWFVGVVLGIVSWGTAFTREGYIGASLNPARCFGAYVASEFPTYHWIHWVGPLAASIGHGLVYYIDPLWTESRSSP
ncbi:MIP transporter [Penicillium waksmanii]|uniref:MIP transporter n=1 Tax=Penicillium waksmanii TaxID=69791 RepID=UPI002547AFEE|nr:MIP transporter [Penicillium waksmanii]KAJ5973378.1 MIP transporter [Penicillium waksmanii]